ncbi:MAG TPA: hypothetical protein VLH12_08665 [Usitatibacter sp.]|nr:hypothetical protein [Usitatibacter sp.]
MARLQSDMTQAKSMVGSAMQSIASSVASAKAALGALGVGISVAGIVELLKHTSDAIAEMKDLGDEIGVTAERISRFEAPTRSAGLALTDTTNAIFRMSKAALDARDPTSKAAQALTAIGISTKDLKDLKPDEMFELVARQVDKYADGLSKNNVMQELFNKSGREMNKLVKEIASATELHATVTEKDALQAKKLNDQLLELKMNSEKLWRSLVAEGLPALNDIVAAFIRGKEEGGLWAAAIASASEMFDKLFGKSQKQQLDDINQKIKVEQDFLDMAKTEFVMASSKEASQTRLNQLLQQRAGLEHAIFEQELDAQNRRAISGLKPGDSKPTINFDPAAAALQLKYLDQLASAETLLAKAKADGMGENFKLTEAEVALLNVRKSPDWKKFNDTQRQKITNTLEDAKTQEQLNRQMAVMAESAAAISADQQKMAEEYEALVEKGDDRVRQLGDEIEQQQLAADAIGKTNLERDLELLDYQRKIALRSAITQGQIDEINGMYDQLKAIAALKSGREDALSTWNELSDGASRFFSDLIVNGGHAFDKLRTFVKQLLADMIALFAKRWILSLAAGGGLLGGAGSALAGGGGGGGGSLAGSLLSGGSSLLGGGGLGLSAGFYGGAGAGIIGGLGANMATLGVAASAGAAAVGGLAEVALAAIPVIGWIVAIGAVLYTIFGSSGGGPKGGGSFMGQFNAAGRFLGGTTVPGSDNGRFFTPNNADPQLQQAGTALAASFFGTLQSLGGTVHGPVSLGLGFDTDPSGTAQNRISSNVTVGGRRVFGSQDREVGRDDAELQSQMQLESERMILAALQASDLPPAIASILNSVDAMTASKDAVENILAVAGAFKQLTDLLGDFDPDKIIKDAMRSSTDLFRDQSSALLTLAGNTDMSLASIQNLSQATNTFRQSAAQLIVAFESAKQQIDGMFNDTRRNIQMGGMTDQERYDFLQAEAARTFQQLQGATSPEEIQRMSDLVNRDINDAFSLLSPEDQRANRADFISRLDTTNATIQSRLQTLQQQVVTDTKDALTRIEALMTAQATSMQKAADTQSNAADKNLAAANTPLQIDLRVDGNQQVTGLA